MRRPPSGTVTFLCTDIEGSAELREARPSAMKRALERHQELLRDAIDDHRGYVFTTEGDALAAAFPLVELALGAAVAAQRAIEGEPWDDGTVIRVRMALHVDQAAEGEADYFGPALSCCARVHALAHGGQVLVSAAVAAATQALNLGEIGLIDLGVQRLEDLSQPEHVHQLTHPGLPRRFPSPKGTA
jgi:class 3 adenylate cyclase